MATLAEELVAAWYRAIAKFPVQEQTITFPIEWQDEGLALLDRLTTETETETTEGDEATDEIRGMDGECAAAAE